MPQFVVGKHGEAEFFRYAVNGTYLGLLANAMPAGQTAHGSMIPFTTAAGENRYLWVTMDTGTPSQFMTDYIYTNGKTFIWTSDRG